MNNNRDNFIYLDYAALTPLLPGIKPAVLQEDITGRVNPQLDNRFSEKIMRRIKKGERDLLKYFATSEFEAEVIWTSGGTESNNLAVLGCLNSFPESTALVESTAHKALLAPASRKNGSNRVCIQVQADQEGILDWDAIKDQAAQANLAGVCHVNNETGVIQDLIKLRTWLDRYARKAFLMVDALQSFGKLDIPWNQAGIDLLSIGGRKIGGPGHVGALIVRRGVPLHPLMFGGNQQNGLRPGTLDAPGIIDFLQAAEISFRNMKSSMQQVQRLNEYLRQRLFNEDWPDPKPVAISSTSASPYILNFSIHGRYGDVITRSLARKNIIAGTGSACSSQTAGISHVLQAMQLPKEIAHGAIRVSLDHRTSSEEIDLFINALRDVLKEY